MDSLQAIERQTATLLAALNEPPPVSVEASLIAETMGKFRPSDGSYFVRREHGELHHVEVRYSNDTTTFTYFVDGSATNRFTAAGTILDVAVHKDGTFDLQLDCCLESCEVAPVLRMGPRTVSQGTRIGRSVRYGHATYCNLDLGIVVRSTDGHDAPQATAITEEGQAELARRAHHHAHWRADQVHRVQLAVRTLSELVELWCK